MLSYVCLSVISFPPTYSDFFPILCPLPLYSREATCFASLTCCFEHGKSYWGEKKRSWPGECSGRWIQIPLLVKQRPLHTSLSLDWLHTHTHTHTHTQAHPHLFFFFFFLHIYMVEHCCNKKNWALNCTRVLQKIKFHSQIQWFPSSSNTS